MKRIALLFFVTSFCIIPVFTQTEAWRATYDFSVGAIPNLYPSKDIGREIGFDAAGNIYMLVTSQAWLSRTSDSPVDYHIFKYNREGIEQWHKDGGSDSYWFSTKSNLKVTPPGDVYRAYTSYYYYYNSAENYGGGRHDANISRLCRNGLPAWSAHWNNEQYNGDDWAVAFDVDQNDNVYFLIRSNFSNSINSNYHPVLQKYDKFGNQLWENTLEGTMAYDLASDATGDVYVLQLGWIKKYDSSSGELISSGEVEYFWDDDGLETNPTRWAPVVGHSIEVSPEGNIYVVGFAKQRHWFWDGATNDWDSESFNNIYTAKFDSDCNLLWSDEYGIHENEDFPRELSIDSDGNALITGDSHDQMITLKYLPDGTLDETSLYSHNGALFHIIGGYAYTLESPSSDTSSPSLTQYLLSTGNEEWQLPLAGLQTYSHINVDPGGDVFISGSVHDGEIHSGPSSNYADDMVLIKYDIPDCCNGVNNDGNEYIDLPDYPDCPSIEPEPIIRCFTFLGRRLCYYRVIALIIPMLTVAIAASLFTSWIFLLFRKRKRNP